MKPSVDIIIVNWNAGAQLRQCLDSIAAADLTGLQLERVVVVDNASTDGSADTLSSSSLPLLVIRNRENRGFAAACNQGVRGSTAGYLLFLNPDTVLMRDSLRVPVSFMDIPVNSRVGICGIQLTDESGRVAQSCSRFPTAFMFISKMIGLQTVLPPALARQPMTDWDHATSRDVDQVIGAFFLVRRGLFDDLDGFDERFFVYFEEVDFARRAAGKGFRSHYLADARAFHRGGGCSDQVKALRLRYNLQSRIEYALKHFSSSSATALVFATLLVEPPARLTSALLRGALSDFAEILAAYGAVWRRVPELIRAAGKTKATSRLR